MKKLSNRVYLVTFLTLIPLILFGFYKNGILLYSKHLVGFIDALKPLIMIFISAAGAILGTFLREYKTNKDIKLIFEHSKVLILESIILACLLPINSSPIIVFVMMILMARFLRRLDINRIAVFYLAIELINKILGLNNFANIYEQNATLVLDGADRFLGMGIGGIASTSVLLVFLGLLVLSFNKMYKKEIAYSSILTFIVLVIIYAFIKEDYTGIFRILFGYNTLFIFVYFTPNLYSSSYTDGGKILTGIITGFITFILHGVLMYNSAMIGILITSILRKSFDKLFIKKGNKDEIKD